MSAHLRCPSCDRSYAYELPVCSWCRVPLDAHDPIEPTVLGVTRVDTPSTGHEDVPYWCALVEDKTGVLSLVKLMREIRAGDRLDEAAEELEVLSVGVIGTGIMGRGLVELMATLGWDVVWLSRDAVRAQKALDRVMDRLSRTMDEAELEAAASLIHVTTDATALSDRDIVIEAIVEDLDMKRELLTSIEPYMKPEALLVTNTSGLPLDALSEVLEHPERFGALHFFNPVTRMRLVETSTGPATSDDVAAELDTLSIALGKQPVRVKARPAFVVNRVLMPLLNEAVRSLEEGAATPEHIDEAVRLGLNHPMGPLALSDLIGLDVVVRIMENIAEQTGDDSYLPRPLLRRMVDEGNLGRKTGVGFFDYR